jgi:glutamate racemase
MYLFYMTVVQSMPLLLDPMPYASADAPIGVFDSGIGGG